MTSTIIIVGAGASGLMAARLLSEKKFNVIVLESRDEAGGRIRTFELPDKSGVVEAGAEFIHGNLPVTLALCNEAGIKYIPHEGKMYRREKNEWVEEDQMIEGWDKLIKKMRSAKDDATLSEFLEEHYSGDQYAELRMNIMSYVMGFDLADPERVSVKALYREWSHEEEENYHIPGGYKQLVAFLETKCRENGCTFVYGDAVRQIDWQKEDVTAYTASGKKYRANKIVVTVPVSVLENIAGRSSINFTPPLDHHISASADIGFGTVIKIIVCFRKRLWRDDTRFIFTEETIPTWWTQYPDTINTLTGWVGGPRASHLEQHSEDELLEIALSSLSHIFNKSIEEIKNEILQSYIFNWRRDPDALGAYSYPTPRTPKARELFNTPLSESLFFAGECFYEGDYPGTVEAALTDGRDVAKRILAL